MTIALDLRARAVLAYLDRVQADEEQIVREGTKLLCDMLELKPDEVTLTEVAPEAGVPRIELEVDELKFRVTRAVTEKKTPGGIVYDDVVRNVYHNDAQINSLADLGKAIHKSPFREIEFGTNVVDPDKPAPVNVGLARA